MAKVDNTKTNNYNTDNATDKLIWLVLVAFDAYLLLNGSIILGLIGATGLLLYILLKIKKEG